MFKDEHPHLRHSETLWEPGWGPYKLEKVPGSHKPMAFWKPDDHEQTNADSYGFEPTRSVNPLKQIGFAITMATIKITWRKEIRAAQRLNEQHFDRLIAGRVNKHDLRVLSEGLDEIKADRTGLDYAQQNTSKNAYRHMN